MPNKAPARPSATVVLVRDGDDAPELLMMQRSARSSFASTFVFPGGVLEADDAGAHARCQGITAEQANKLLETDNALDYYCAAVREVFEETGVLLGDCATALPELASLRQKLNDGTIGWQAILQNNDIQLQCDRLHYFDFWLTPVAHKKRFSTRFFLAAVSGSEQAEHCGAELTDSRWMTSKEILATQADGAMQIAFPTETTVGRLAAFSSVAEIIEWCRQRQRAGVRRIHPTLVDGKPVIE